MTEPSSSARDEEPVGYCQSCNCICPCVCGCPTCGCWPEDSDAK